MSKKDRKAKELARTTSFSLGQKMQPIKIKPNTHGKVRWYYDERNDRTGQHYMVTNSSNPSFKNHWSLNSSLFFDKEDCELVADK
jgi:hypothetical protein